jgi:hypothetical protein
MIFEYEHRQQLNYSSKDLNTAIYQVLPQILERQQGQSQITTTSVSSSTQRTPPSDPLPPNSEAVAAFTALMKSRRESPRSWIGRFPLGLLRLNGRDFGSGRINFVHVGGRDGRNCAALKQRFQGLLGGMVIQFPVELIFDVDHNFLASYGIQSQVFDTSKEQPVKQPKSFYMRHLLHDLTDDRCVELLKWLADACADDTLVLIDEMVRPDVDDEWRQSEHGLQLMTYLSSTERNRAQWSGLLEQAGLKLWRTFKYDDELRDSVIVAKKAEA